MKMQEIIVLLSLMVAGIICLECPDLCQCVSSMMDCKKPGLESLPPAPSSKLEMVVIANQTFRRTTLDGEALRPYWSPEHGGQIRLRLLKIRNCNIVSLASNAFANLGSQLEELDLSGNPLHTIAAHVFTGLRLKSLFLNNLLNPAIHDQAFSSITEVQSLSIQSSHSTSLPLRPLIELVNFHGLKSLSLRGNKISRLPPVFEPVFRLLQTFELSENPWHCDCNLRWLIQLHKLSRPTKTTSVLSGNSESSRNDIRQPVCISPIEFAGYTFDEVTLNESEVLSGLQIQTAVPKRPILSCVMPRVEHIDVDLRQPNSELEVSNLARISCQMRGAPELLISWVYHLPSGEVRNVTGMAKQQEDGHMMPYPFAPPQPKRLTSRLSVKQVSETDVYSCVGQNLLGNASVTVSIHWPQNRPEGMLLPPDTNDFGEKQLLEVMPNGLAGPVEDMEHGILAKRFSLVDVIGAVLGTFFVTMLMFIIAYRTSKLYVYRRSKLRSQSDLMLRPHDNTKRTPDGTSSSGASSSLLKFSQLQVASSSRYPLESKQAVYQHQGGGGFLMQPKQRDSGTFTSHSTTSSQNANGLGGAYETVYNESCANQVMYESPGDSLAATACHQNHQPFLFQFAQPPPLTGYPLVFGSTLPSHSASTAAFALGVSNPSAPTYIPPPPTGRPPSLPGSVQTRAGPLHVYSSTIHMADQFPQSDGGGVCSSVNAVPQHNRIS
ncbi:unnamed protein product [Mesocestoides corti]|uniref:Ig-like domain-containing protein n=1 Tax=Mesocestoides corti TaxID=53468 RepID=A0A0R3UHK8_MESCO|nr:unnamed protein product [Mesocestoides corti]